MAMHRWHAEAQPILARLMAAEDALLSASEGPAVVITASSDQLHAAVWHTQLWLQAHRCPDTEFGMYCAELTSACLGLCAVMQMVAREAPEGQWIGDHDLVERVGTNLLDRIEQANRARRYLGKWNE